MIRLDFGLKREIGALAAEDGAVRKMLRAKQVEELFRESVVEVYGDTALLILQEVNAVYILREDEGEGASRGAQVGGSETDAPGGEGAGIAEAGRPHGSAPPPLPATAAAPKHLIVYAVDSMVRASITEKREHLKAALSRRGEDIGEFTVKMSRFNMKKRHPYTAQNAPEMGVLEQERRRRIIASAPLSEAQGEYIRACGAAIEDERLRASFCKAMETDFKTRNCEFGKK